MPVICNPSYFEAMIVGLNPIALRMAKTQNGQSFGHTECNRLKYCACVGVLVGCQNSCDNDSSPDC